MTSVRLIWPSKHWSRTSFQAAIASLHAEDEPDWPQLAALYGELARRTGSAVAAAALHAAGRGVLGLDLQRLAHIGAQDAQQILVHPPFAGERHQRRHRDHRAGLHRQSGAGPGGAEKLLVEVVGETLVELAYVSVTGLCLLLPEELAAEFHSLFLKIVGHDTYLRNAVECLVD